jgi:hypothetical protein
VICDVDPVTDRAAQCLEAFERAFRARPHQLTRCELALNPLCVQDPIPGSGPRQAGPPVGLYDRTLRPRHEVDQGLDASDRKGENWRNGEVG